MWTISTLKEAGRTELEVGEATSSERMKVEASEGEVERSFATMMPPPLELPPTS
jgi:hypothetical protein